MGNIRLKFILLILILATCFWFGKTLAVDFDSIKTYLKNLSPLVSGFIFVALYVSVTFFAWLTKDVFKIVGAVLFGAYLSTFYIWLAEMINALILFHLSRKLGRVFIESQLKGKWARMDKKIEETGFWGIFLLRTVPLVPFRFLDLACGLTRIPFKKYFMIVLLGTPLRIFWIQFILAGVGESITRDPRILIPTLVNCLTTNSIIFLWSFLYLCAAVVLIIKIKKRLET